MKQVRIIDLYGNKFDLLIEGEVTINAIREKLLGEYNFHTDRCYFCRSGKILDNKSISKEIFNSGTLNNPIVVFNTQMFPDKSFPYVDNSFNIDFSRYSQYSTNSDLMHQEDQITDNLQGASFNYENDQNMEYPTPLHIAAGYFGDEGNLNNMNNLYYGYDDDRYHRNQYVINAISQMENIDFGSIFNFDNPVIRFPSDNEIRQFYMQYEGMNTNMQNDQVQQTIQYNDLNLLQPSQQSDQNELVQNDQLRQNLNRNAENLNAQLNLTDADNQAISRLVRAGFEWETVMQAYIACEKNEEDAMNLLIAMG